MKNESFEIIGKLVHVENLKNSYYDNPRRLVMIGEMAARTEPNSSLAFSISNHYGKEVVATCRMLRGKLHVTHVKENA